ncbi:MAG: SagB family peptide dehydrogenase [Acidimicrobiia bacterium]
MPDELDMYLAKLSAKERDELLAMLSRSRHERREHPLDALLLAHDYIAPVIGHISPSARRLDKESLTKPLSIAGTPIELPKPAPLTIPLDAALARRHSDRSRYPGSMQLSTLSTVLFHAASARATYRGYGRNDLIFRRVASAGGIESVELLVSIRDVDGIDRGVYVYDAREHAFLQTPVREPVTAIARACGQEIWMLEAPCVIFFVGRIRRLRWKYDSLALRVLLQDVGNLQANLLLTSSAVDLTACISSGIDSDSLVEDFGLTPGEDLILSSLVLGPPRSSATPEPGKAQEQMPNTNSDQGDGQ